MKKLNSAALALALVASALLGVQPAQAASGSTPLPDLKSGDWEQLKYSWTTPASGNDYSGTVVGNGRIGARIAGGVAAETLQLNDKTFWSGEPVDNGNVSHQTALVETRRLLAEADRAADVATRESLIKQAERAAEGMWTRPPFDARYLPIGKLLLDVPGTSGYTGYSRVLDLDRATVTTQYTVGATTYTREVFANHPDNVIVMRITNSTNTPMSLTAKLAFPSQMAGHAAVQSSGNEIVMTGTAPYNLGQTSSWADGRGTTFDSRVRVSTTGGTVTAADGNLAVADASEIVLYYSSATSYKDPFTLPNPAQGGNDPAPIVEATMDAAVAKPFAELRDEHVADYQSLFRRLWLEVNGNTGAGAGNVKTYQYSRYEMISLSRENTDDRPRNQQGMWNPDWVAENDSSHFLNENVEKHYANIETANLPELGDPLWKFLENLAIKGADTAATDFGFDGWTAPHYTDIWATTGLAGGNNQWAIWPVGGMWMMNTVYEHYLFTGDRDFLSNTAYPMMKGSAEFALDLLVEDKDGYLVTSPSTSPENRYRLSDGTTAAISQGTTGDMTLVRQLFHDVVEAAETLDLSSPEDVDLIARIKAATAKLPPIEIDAQGAIKEWRNDYVSYDPSHRHASHLIGVNLRDVITKRGTPELFAAAKKALELRGTGGYMPDNSYMWARFGEADKAVATHKLYAVDPGRNKYGTISAYVPELFIQSHAGEIELLPSLPTGWDSGKLVGVKARGGYEVSIEWANRQLVSAQIDSPLGTTPTVRYQNKLVNVADDPRITLVGADADLADVIVDDSAATATGEWAASTTYTGYYGTGYLASRSGTGADTIRWTPELAKAGTYNVYVNLPDGVYNRASNATYSVDGAGEPVTFSLDQRVSPSPGWRLLGAVDFEAGATGHVELTDDGDGNYVIADAVRFEYVGASEPPAELRLTPSASIRCVGGKVYIAAAVSNDDDVPADVTITSTYGTKTFADVAPGKHAFAVFTTRAASIAEGSVQVEGAGGDLAYSGTAAYAAKTCG